MMKITEKNVRIVLNIKKLISEGDYTEAIMQHIDECELVNDPYDMVKQIPLDRVLNYIANKGWLDDLFETKDPQASFWDSIDRGIDDISYDNNIGIQDPRYAAEFR